MKVQLAPTRPPDHRIQSRSDGQSDARVYTMAAPFERIRRPHRRNEEDVNKAIRLS